MSKADKLLEKLLSAQSDGNFTFADLFRSGGFEGLVFGAQAHQHAGFIHEHVSGSHHIFRHSDRRMISIPVHGRTVKRVYVKAVRELLTT